MSGGFKLNSIGFKLFLIGIVVIHGSECYEGCTVPSTRPPIGRLPPPAQNRTWLVTSSLVESGWHAPLLKVCLSGSPPTNAKPSLGCHPGENIFCPGLHFLPRARSLLSRGPKRLTLSFLCPSQAQAPWVATQRGTASMLVKRPRKVFFAGRSTFWSKRPSPLVEGQQGSPSGSVVEASKMRKARVITNPIAIALTFWQADAGDLVRLLMPKSMRTRAINDIPKPLGHSHDT